MEFSVFTNISLIMFIIGIALATILGITSPFLYAAVPSDINDPKYASKKDTADAVTMWAQVFGWICLIGLLSGIGFAFLGPKN